MLAAAVTYFNLFAGSVHHHVEATAGPTLSPVITILIVATTITSEAPASARGARGIIFAHAARRVGMSG